VNLSLESRLEVRLASDVLLALRLARAAIYVPEGVKRVSPLHFTACKYRQISGRPIRAARKSRVHLATTASCIFIARSWKGTKTRRECEANARA
jgi:diphthamide synthase subunit DPH2